MPLLLQFVERLEKSIKENQFVSLTLSKKRLYDSDLEKITIKPVLLGSEIQYQFVYRHTTKDITKNIPSKSFIQAVNGVLEDHMKNANLFTITGDHVLQQNKKRRWKLYGTKPSITELPDFSHDKKKFYLLDKDRPFLKELGIVNASGKIIKEKGDKYRQIQKFVEIIDNLVDTDKRKRTEDNPISIVDMGSGKAYLTFALYDYIIHSRKTPIKMTGVELRPNLVTLCNEVANKLNFEKLEFVVGGISESIVDSIDMLIALHACDTATDDAIYKGITNEVKWIVCSPCCQHQVRKDMENRSFLKGILKHGILMERMAELLTDGLRALILESYGYKTKVFEFISHQHTGKNLMIVAEKGKEVTEERKKEIWNEIDQIKSTMNIKRFYLQTLFQN